MSTSSNCPHCGDPLSESLPRHLQHDCPNARWHNWGPGSSTDAMPTVALEDAPDEISADAVEAAARERRIAHELAERTEWPSE